MPVIGGTRRRPTHPKLGRVIGRHATKNPPVRRPRVVLASVLNRSLLRRVRTETVRTRTFGYVTRKPPVRRPTIRLAAIVDRSILARVRTRTFLRRPQRAVVVARHVRAVAV